jgi:Fur family ferric uptake transcriptional regulator
MSTVSRANRFRHVRRRSRGPFKKGMIAIVETSASSPDVTRRATSQRSAVRDSLRSSDSFRTAQAIHAELRLQGARIGLATVYRHLQLFVDEGLVHTVQLDDRQTAYRWCGQSAHHHHLVCRSCGASRELADTEFEARVAVAAEGQGFTDLTHSFEIFGVCPSCQR